MPDEGPFTPAIVCNFCLTSLMQLLLIFLSKRVKNMSTRSKMRQKRVLNASETPISFPVLPRERGWGGRQSTLGRPLDSRWLLYFLLCRHRADESQPARNSCPRLPHSVDSRFGLYHVASVLSFLRSPTALQKFESKTEATKMRLGGGDFKF